MLPNPKPGDGHGVEMTKQKLPPKLIDGLHPKLKDKAADHLARVVDLARHLGWVEGFIDGIWDADTIEAWAVRYDALSALLYRASGVELRYLHPHGDSYVWPQEPPSVESVKALCLGVVVPPRKKASHTVCNKCGDVSNSAPGLVCGRIEEDEDGDGGGSACAGVYETPADKTDDAQACCKCGGTNVQMAKWVNPNTGEVFGDFGSYDETDTKWCNDCDDNVTLKDGSAS